jgi:hypothetical protein
MNRAPQPQWALLAMAAMLACTAAVRAQETDDPSPDESEATSPTAETEQTTEPEQGPPTPAAHASAERALSLYAGAGLGIGTLSFDRPTAAGEQKLPQTPFAAADLMFRVRAWPKDRFSLEALLAYQTSLGLVLQTSPLFALPQNVGVRAQRIELSVAPVLRLAEAPNAPVLAFPIGLAVHSLFPELHQFSMPKYTLGGPQLRAELWLQLGDLVRLRAGPEAELLLLVSSSLRSEGACCQGLSLGGRASVEASVGPVIRIALSYAEAHRFVPIGSWSFMETERFLTARIAGEL